MKVKTATGYVHVRIPPDTASEVENYVVKIGFPMSFSTAVNFLVRKSLGLDKNGKKGK